MAASDAAKCRTLLHFGAAGRIEQAFDLEHGSRQR